MVGQRALYPGNGAGDRSQTWSKISSKVVLLKYSAIAIFAKIAIWRVFPDMVTYVVHYKNITREPYTFTTSMSDFTSSRTVIKPAKLRLHAEPGGTKNRILSIFFFPGYQA